MRELRRLALWGVAAAGALALLVFAMTTGPGKNRLLQVASKDTQVAKPEPPKPPPAFDAREGQRLAQTVRALTADRDRLLARIATLEQSLEDVTGSIARATAPPPEPSPAPEPQPAAATPASAPEPPVAPATVDAAAPAAADPVVTVAIPAAPPADEPSDPPQPPSEPAAGEAPPQTEFGIDIGRAATIEGLRALWASARSRHGTQLEGLRPVVYRRAGDRPGRRVELHLVVGPIDSATAAAKLCAAMTAAGTACRPTVFDGQRLALR